MLTCVGFEMFGKLLTTIRHIGYNLTVSIVFVRGERDAYLKAVAYRFGLVYENAC